MIYISTGEPLVGDPLPDPFKFSSNLSLRRNQTVREAGMVGEGAMNRCLGDWDGNNSDPIVAQAARALARNAAERGMPLTIDAEGVWLYDSNLWHADNAECKRRIGMVVSLLSIWKAYHPGVQRYVFNGTPGKRCSLDHDYVGFIDYEAEALAPLVSGPNIDKYQNPWKPIDFWEQECELYREWGRERYDGKPKLVVSPQKWDENGKQVGYVGDDVMAYQATYAAKHNMHCEWFGLAHTTLGPQTEAWAWLNKKYGRVR